MFKKTMNLYRRRTFQASLVLLLALTFVFSQAFAQRRKPHKLRATGVLELTKSPSGTVSARLIPVTILDQGRFEDASIYKAAPEPMALARGVVYEAQKTGVPVGYITITNSSKAGDIWEALGNWQPASQEAKEAKKTEEPARPTNPDDDRPILHRGSGSAESPASTPTPTPAAQSTPEPTPAPPPEPEPEDSDRPVLRRRSPGSNSSTSESAPVAVSTPTPNAKTSGPRQKPFVPATGTQTLVAVSDAQPSDTRSYEFPWKPGEQETIEAKMRKFALAQLPKENAQLDEHSMQNVVIRAFDLDLSNEATIVLTAEIPASYVAPGQKGAPSKFVSRYLTVIARMDYEGNLQRLAVSVTDSSRLDVAPRLELIDAVDVDGDGLAELLFREYGFDQKGYVIYGIGHGTVTKVFEGATSSLQQSNARPGN